MNKEPTMIKIDKGVPVPVEGTRGGRKTIYPWAEMQPGDSFFAPRAKHANVNVNRVRKHVPNSTWTTRTVTENGIRGIRVWRLT